MFFFSPIKSKPESKRDFAASDTASTIEYRLNRMRLLAGTVLLSLLIGCWFLSSWLVWETGASAFLHLTEVGTGAFFGFLFGERSALSDIKKR